MSPKIQRIAIAEACGWRQERSAVDWLCYRPDNVCVGYSALSAYPTGIDAWSSWFEYDTVPDYLSDLNAMHEAEKGLDTSQAEKYVKTLAETMLNEASQDMLDYYGAANWYNIYVILSATAAQRAEAFLRTLGKWTDS
jgi:hypothetical protein